jgi:rhodanese-related sulfurtransferase
MYLSLGSLYLRPVHADDMETIQTAIRKRFPDIRQLQPTGLRDWLADSSRVPPLLVDVRDSEEFKVSHLRNATNVVTAGRMRKLVASPDAPVVVYCSVGYRSSAVAAKLVKLGCTNVWNLEGSIFAWANAGYPLYRGTNQVFAVHPYNTKWGKLLAPKFHPPSR